MAIKQDTKQETDTPVATTPDTPVATPLQQPDILVTAVALVHKLEVEGMVYAKGTRFTLPASKAKALHDLGRVGNIGA